MAAARPAAVSENTRGRFSDRPREPQMQRMASSRRLISGNPRRQRKPRFGEAPAPEKEERQSARKGGLPVQPRIGFGTARRIGKALRNRSVRLTGPQTPARFAGDRCPLPRSQDRTEHQAEGRKAQGTSIPQRQFGARLRGARPDATSITMRQHPRCGMHSPVLVTSITAAVGSTKGNARSSERSQGGNGAGSDAGPICRSRHQIFLRSAQRWPSPRPREDRGADLTPAASRGSRRCDPPLRAGFRPSRRSALRYGRR